MEKRLSCTAVVLHAVSQGRCTRPIMHPRSTSRLVLDPTSISALTMLRPTRPHTRITGRVWARSSLASPSSTRRSSKTMRESQTSTERSRSFLSRALLQSVHCVVQTNTTYAEKFNYRGREPVPNGTEEILPHAQNELKAGYNCNKPKDTIGSAFPHRQQGYITSDALLKLGHTHPMSAENAGSGPALFSTQTATAHSGEALLPTRAAHRRRLVHCWAAWCRVLRISCRADVQGKNIKM